MLNKRGRKGRKHGVKVGGKKKEKKTAERKEGRRTEKDKLNLPNPGILTAAVWLGDGP